MVSYRISTRYPLLTWGPLTDPIGSPRAFSVPEPPRLIPGPLILPVLGPYLPTFGLYLLSDRISNQLTYPESTDLYMGPLPCTLLATRWTCFLIEIPAVVAP